MNVLQHQSIKSRGFPHYTYIIIWSIIIPPVEKKRKQEQEEEVSADWKEGMAGHCIYCMMMMMDDGLPWWSLRIVFPRSWHQYFLLKPWVNIERQDQWSCMCVHTSRKSYPNDECHPITPGLTLLIVSSSDWLTSIWSTLINIASTSSWSITSWTIHTSPCWHLCAQLCRVHKKEGEGIRSWQSEDSHYVAYYFDS